MHMAGELLRPTFPVKYRDCAAAQQKDRHALIFSPTAKHFTNKKPDHTKPVT
jgi:hypothetical protein